MGKEALRHILTDDFDDGQDSLRRWDLKVIFFKLFEIILIELNLQILILHANIVITGCKLRRNSHFCGCLMLLIDKD